MYKLLSPELRRQLVLVAMLWGLILVSVLFAADSTPQPSQWFTMQNFVTGGAVLLATGSLIQSLKDVRLRVTDLETRIDRFEESLPEKYVTKELFEERWKRIADHRR